MRQIGVEYQTGTACHAFMSTLFPPVGIRILSDGNIVDEATPIFPFSHIQDGFIDYLGRRIDLDASVGGVETSTGYVMARARPSERWIVEVVAFERHFEVTLRAEAGAGLYGRTR